MNILIGKKEIIPGGGDKKDKDGKEVNNSYNSKKN